MAILVDSSVWIAADRKTSKSKEYSSLKKLIDENKEQILICSIIQVEVCQGARSQDEFSLLWEAFRGFDMLPIGPDHWELCAWHYFKCRQAGITPSTIDCLIATLAHSYRVALWSIDQAFDRIRPIVPFETFSP